MDKYVSNVYSAGFYRLRLRQLRRVRWSLDSESAGTLAMPMPYSLRPAWITVTYCWLGHRRPGPTSYNVVWMRLLVLSLVSTTGKFDRDLLQLMHVDLHWLDVSERMLPISSVSYRINVFITFFRHIASHRIVMKYRTFLTKFAYVLCSIKHFRHRGAQDGTHRCQSLLMPNPHRRRDETVLSRRVGVGGVNMNSQLAHDDCWRIRSTIWKLAKQTVSVSVSVYVWLREFW